MTSITLSISDYLRTLLGTFEWVNWSEISREEILKKIIFEKYLTTKSLSDEDWKFCEKIDWHPVDELPMKEEFKRKLEKIKKEKSIKLKSVSEIFNKIK